MSKKYLSTFRDFSKGQIDKDAPNLIPDNALVEAKNAIIGRGYVEKRYGYQKYSNMLSSAITKLFDFYKKDGSKEFLSVSNKKVYKDSSGTLSVVTGSLSSSEVEMISYKDKDLNDVVLIADGGKLKIYNGSSVAEVAPHSPTTEQQTDPGLNDLEKLTNFRCLAIKKDRIFAVGHPEVKNRLNFCHHDPESGYAMLDYFPATFFIDFATGENDEIVQLEVFRDSLIVLCSRTVWVLYGDGRTIDDYELHKINVPAGCVAPKSVQTVGNELFYLSDDHVYRMYATEQNFVSARVASENIENTLKSISRTDKEKAVGTFFNDKYYLSFPDGTTIVYDTLVDGWMVWTNIKANSFLNREGALYFASNSGYIFKFVENTFNDDGQAIEFSMTTKNMTFDYDVQVKKFKQMWIGTKQYKDAVSSFDVKAIIDYVDVVSLDNTIYQAGIYDESDFDFSTWDFVDVIQSVVRLRQKGKSIQLVFENKQINQPITIYGLSFQYKLKKPK